MMGLDEFWSQDYEGRAREQASRPGCWGRWEGRGEGASGIRKSKSVFQPG